MGSGIGPPRVEVPGRTVAESHCPRAESISFCFEPFSRTAAERAGCSRHCAGGSQRQGPCVRQPATIGKGIDVGALDSLRDRELSDSSSGAASLCPPARRDRNRCGQGRRVHEGVLQIAVQEAVRAHTRADRHERQDDLGGHTWQGAGILRRRRVLPSRWSDEGSGSSSRGASRPGRGGEHAWESTWLTSVRLT